MTAFAKHPFRVTARLVWLAFELFIASVGFFCTPFCRSPRHARARWMHHCCQRLLPVFGIDCQINGSLARAGLLVSNHLSYLDILVIGAACPAVFVAKREVKSWPIFGWLAFVAGTVFVDRTKRLSVNNSAEEITAALNDGLLVVLFPEGTSSDGKSVLPFKSSLLEPATAQNCALTAGLIAYASSDADVGEEICYWKDMTFFPHLINVLSKPAISATATFTRPRKGSPNRKELATQLHTEVLRLKFVGISQAT